jgi:sodium/proline symporter
MILASFCFFLLIFIAIGAMAIFHHKKQSTDYLIASRSVKPWLAALSAVATTNSGYMFVGQIGFTYLYGLYSIWLMVGWVLGDFMTSLFVHRKLRTNSQRRDANSFGAALSSWYGEDYKYLRILAGVVTILFLGTYAAAQLNAGSKALHVLFGWDYAAGAIMGAVIVLIYCFAGGIRASIWTDAAQSIVMLFAMFAMLAMAAMELGGVTSIFEGLKAVDPAYMNWFPPESERFAGLPFGFGLGAFLFVLGWFFAGVGVVGQPHIMVRFMTMDKPSDISSARFYYYGFYILFYCLTIAVALCARLLIPETEGFDAELALPTLADTLLPDILVGLVLAGLFAATMSTADSQILCCSAAITNDIAPKKLSGYFANKVATLSVTAIALTIALIGPDSVFSLVLIAWSALSCAFGPLLIVMAFNGKLSEKLSIAMVLGGLAAMMLWRMAGLNDIMYEVGPGIIAGFAIFGVARLYGLVFNRKECLSS